MNVNNNFSYKIVDSIGENCHLVRTRQKAYSEYNTYWGKILSIIVAEENQKNSKLTANQLWNKIFKSEIPNPKIRRVSELSKLFDTFKSWKNSLGSKSDNINIIDMGAGWGRYSTGLKIRYDVKETIYTLEYTENGRRITQHFIDNYFNDIKSYPFDYYNSDFSMVPKDSDVFVYSTYSIEQITNLKEDVFLNLINRFSRVRGFHLEPVGWQFPAPYSKHEMQLKTKCLKVGYNVNFYETIMKLVNENKIKIVEIIRDFKCDRKDATLLIWEKL